LKSPLRPDFKALKVFKVLKVGPEEEIKKQGAGF
jgi:hypothetical protein